MENINRYIISQLKRPVDRLKLMAIGNIINILSAEELCSLYDEIADITDDSNTYDWDAIIRRMVNERLDEQYADTQCMPSIENMWLLYCKIARHNFPKKYAYMVAEDPRCIKHRNEMINELKPFIEQFGFEIEDDGNFGAYIDESQSPSNYYIISTSSLDEVPF